MPFLPFLHLRKRKEMVVRSLVGHIQDDKRQGGWGKEFSRQEPQHPFIPDGLWGVEQVGAFIAHLWNTTKIFKLGGCLIQSSLFHTWHILPQKFSHSQHSRWLLTAGPSLHGCSKKRTWLPRIKANNAGGKTEVG